MAAHGRHAFVRRIGPGLTVLAIATGAALPAGAGAAPMCLGRAATIVGGEGRVIRGTAGDDVITAYGRRYVVRARAGDDLVCGDPSFDVLYGGKGRDRLHVPAGYGGSKLYGGAGADRLHGAAWTANGGRGDDVISGRLLIGGSGDDVLIGQNGASVAFPRAPRGVRVDLRRGRARGVGSDLLSGDVVSVFASRNDDVLIGDDGRNELFGLGGHDRIAGGTNVDYAFGGAGDDAASGGPGDDFVNGGGGHDRLSGGRGDDVLRPGGGDDLVEAGPGADAVAAKHGDDELDGGPGTDSVHYRNWAKPIEVDLEAGWARGAGADVLRDFAEVSLGAAGDVARGDDGANVLSGDGGDDRIEGRGGDDTIEGGDGLDIGDGGDGNDVCSGVEVSIACEQGAPAAS